MSVEKLLAITYGAAFLIAWVFLLLETRKMANNKTRAFIYYMLFSLLLLVATVALIPKAEAAEGDIRIDATLATIHFIKVPDNVSEFNSENTGLIIEYMTSDSEYVFGGLYKNSFYKKCEVIEQCDELSWVIGTGTIFSESEHIRYALEGALATGYEASDFIEENSEAALLAGVAITYEVVENHGAKFLIAFPGFVGVSYQYGFDGI